MGEMTYQDIVNLVFTIITAILAIPTLHHVVFAVLGLFCNKKYPKSEKYCKYGIVISARNEEKVVGNLVESIRKNNYPQELLTIFVVAHNCSDNTARVARDAGAVVYTYDNPNERTKGFALKHLFQCISEDYGFDSFDGFIMLDADNLLAENYIEKMNDAFNYWGCSDAVISYRNSKNFGQNVISGLYGLHFVRGCRLESRGRNFCRCSTRVPGTGFVMSCKAVQNGWKYVTLTEDWEFSADQVLQGTKIRYCNEAVFYDEQPVSVKIMLRQRLRWAKGHLMVFKTKGAQLFTSLFRREIKNKGSAYDMFTCIVPYSVLGLFLSIIQFVLLSPLFGVPLFGGLTLWEYVSQANILPVVGWSIPNWVYWIVTLVVGYLAYVADAVFVFILENKRIKNISVGKRVGVALLWPIFNILTVPLQIVALFSKVEWKVIPHTAAITHDALHGASAPQVAATEAKPSSEAQSPDEELSK